MIGYSVQSNSNRVVSSSGNIPMHWANFAHLSFITAGLDINWYTLNVAVLGMTYANI